MTEKKLQAYPGAAKGHSFPGPATNALDRLSKSALVDCMLDALGLQNECDPDEVTPAMVAEFCNPRLRLRGDRRVRANPRV